jgi:hypothetical protein
MSGHSGYTLDQLLEWCTQAHLIEGFRNDGEFVWIFQNGIETELDHVAAKKYLKSIFTGVDRRDESGPDNSDSMPNIA